MMDNFEFNPLNPLNIHYGKLALSVIIGMLLDLATYSHLWGIFGITWILIITFMNYQSMIQFIKLIINHELVYKLQLLINSDNLEDQRMTPYGREVAHSVIFQIKNYANHIRLTIFPNGIKNSRIIDDLGNDISRIFNAEVEKAPNSDYGSVTYIIQKHPTQRMDVNNHGLF